jgi:hypothetical protein
MLCPVAMTMDTTTVAWMMAFCVAIGAAIVYFAYRYGRMAQRLSDQDAKQ